MTAGRTPSSQIRVLLLVIQWFAEHVRLSTDDPIEDFSEDMATGSTIVNKIITVTNRK